MFDHDLSVYIPQDRRLALAHDVPLPDRMVGAALCADISGFTPLTEGLARVLGPRRGAEELTHQLNRVYDALIAEVERFGGSVIGFSGDAITCWFDDNSFEFSVLSSEFGGSETQNSKLKTQNSAGLRATACALAMQATMAQFATVALPNGDTVTLALKTGVATGPARRFAVGDPAIQLLDVLAGATIDRLSIAEHTAEKGEVVLDGQTAASLGGTVQIAEWRSLAHESSAVVNRLNIEPEALNKAVPDAAASSHSAMLNAQLLRPWILPAVYNRELSGQGAFLAELRPAVALFLSFGQIDYDGDPAAEAKLDAYVCWVQRTIARYDGALIQITIGDKGSYMYIGFGALVAHDDDVARAVAAALELRAPPARLDLAPALAGVQIGISQGTMRVGAFGGRTRRTYGALGDEVNLAARLMQRAAPGQIIVTQRVADAVSRMYRCQALGSISVKGKQNLVPIFEVLDRHSGAVPLGRIIGNARKLPAAIIGRKAERTRLAECIQILLRGGSIGPVIIEGEAGIGKSRLMEDALQIGLESGIICFVGTGDAIERSSPYHAWRPIFSQLFMLDALPEDTEARREYVLAQLASDPDLLRLAPLLNAVLPLDLPENDLTAPLSGQVRADNTGALLVRLLQRVASTGPLLLLMEDAHWLDSASWELMQRVGRDIQPVLQIIATRPLVEPLGPEYHQLWSATGIVRLKLEPLPLGDITALVCQRLGVAALPSAMVELISQRAEGHPFFSEELAYALRDAGLILITPGAADGEPARCRIAPQVDFTAISVPDTIQGVITSRVDRLAPAQQLVLKVASVIGRVFWVRALRDVYPIEADKPGLIDCLNDLQRLDLTRLDAPEPDLAYLFKHVITQEVSYNLMLFVQRRALHEAVARWYEHTYADDLAPFYPLLAHHWRRAESTTKAAEYLEQAATQALSRGVNKEACDLFTALLALDSADAARPAGQAARDPSHARRRAHWMSGLARAYHGLGQLVETRRYAEQAVAVLDRPPPASAPGAGMALVGQIFQQALHRLLPARFTGRIAPEAARADLLEAVHLYRELIAVYWSANQLTHTFYACVRCVNVAERAGPSGLLVGAYGMMAYACIAVKLRALADYYYGKIRATDRIVQEPFDLAQALIANSLGRIGLGQWRTIQEDVGKAIEIYAHFGAWQGWGEGMATLAYIGYYAGEYARCDLICDQLLPVTRRNNNILHQIWALLAKGLAASRQGQQHEAIAVVEETRALLSNTAERASELSGYGILAQAYWMLGEPSEARQHADTATHMIAQSSVPTAHHAYEGYFGPARVYLALWEAGKSGTFSANDLAAADAAARQACAFLRTYAILFPIGEPGMHLCQGLYQWLAGKPNAARAAWRKSLAAARRFAKPYEEGLAHYELGRHAAGAQRQQHLDQAIAIFEQLGAAYDLEQARAAADSAVYSYEV